MLLTIPIFMHCLSDKSSIEKSFVLTRIINGGNEVRKKQAESYGDLSYNCFLGFKRSLSVEKNDKRRVPVSHYLGSNETISAGSTKGEKLVRYDGMIPLLSRRWKACIVRNSLLGGDISKDETERIQLFCRDRYLQNSIRFFKFYNPMEVSKNGSDCYQSDFDSLLLREIHNKRDLDRLQATQLKNDLLSPVVLDSCDKTLLESVDSADRWEGGSVSYFEREAFSNLSSFTSCKKTRSFHDCISGVDCDKNREDFLILHPYSQMRNELLNRLAEFFLIIEKSNLIFNGAIVFDVSDSIKSGKGFPLKMKENLPFTRVSAKNFGLASSRYFDFNEILPNYFKVSLGIPKKTINRSENTTSSKKLKGKDNIHSIYSLVRLYGRNRIIPLYSTYIFLFCDYFCALSTEYFFRIKYRLDGWTGSGEYTGVTRIATE